MSPVSRPAQKLRRQSLALVALIGCLSMSLALTTPAYGNSGQEKPPPVPKVWYTGDGISIPGGGTVVLFTHPDKHGVFRLTGPAPLQFKHQVACGDAGCVWNHLDWSLFSGEVVSGCGANEPTCDVRVGTRLRLVRRHGPPEQQPPLIYLLWNSESRVAP